MAEAQQVRRQFARLSLRLDDELHNENPDITGQYLRFLGIAAVGLVINNLTIWLLHGRFRLNFYLAKLFAIGVVTFWNFFMNYFFTF